MKVLVLVDGEHYPPVTKWGLDVARSLGHVVCGALFLGGTEKVSSVPDLGVAVFPGGDDLPSSLAAALRESEPEAVLDLSDEPVLGYRERMGLVAVTLLHGVPYLGPGFRFDPPVTHPPLPVPTIAVIGTGKRTGKTAIAGQLARVGLARGDAPVVVAMGRGGPPEPQVADAGSVDVHALMELEAKGQHAASDYLEDALMAGVTTVGARRVGGGLAGGSFATNVVEAARVAVSEGAGLLILEGSGAAVPPVAWDAGILVVPASAPPEYLAGYLGPYRMLLSDLVVFTMASGSDTGAENLSALKSHVQRWLGARFVVTDFEPVAMGDVRGKTVFLATTAPTHKAEQQVALLEASSGCEVVGWSAGLADRTRLTEDMREAKEYEILLTELKAAAVDVACREAQARGAEVVFLDNRAVVREGQRDLDDIFGETIDLAVSRSTNR